MSSSSSSSSFSNNSDDSGYQDDHYLPCKGSRDLVTLDDFDPDFVNDTANDVITLTFVDASSITTTCMLRETFRQTMESTGAQADLCILPIAENPQGYRLKYCDRDARTKAYIAVFRIPGNFVAYVTSAAAKSIKDDTDRHHFLLIYT